jgi:hypothetical protein
MSERQLTPQPTPPRYALLFPNIEHAPTPPLQDSLLLPLKVEEIHHGEEEIEVEAMEEAVEEAEEDPQWPLHKETPPMQLNPGK